MWWCDRSLHHPAQQLLHPPGPLPSERARERTRLTFSVLVALVEKDVTTSLSNFHSRSLALSSLPVFSLSSFSRFACLSRALRARTSFPLYPSSALDSRLTFSPSMSRFLIYLALLSPSPARVKCARRVLCPSLRFLYDESLTNSCLACASLSLCGGWKIVEDTTRYITCASQLSLLSSFSLSLSLSFLCSSLRNLSHISFSTCTCSRTIAVLLNCLYFQRI